jgi:N-acetylmuramate 1-kinase
MTKALQCKVIRMETLAEKSLVEKDLIDLANQYLPDNIQLGDAISVEPLSGDAGFRHYYRLATEPSVLGVSAAPDREDWVAFMRVSSLLSSLGICVPAIYAADLHSGTLLIEDLGDKLYQDVLIEKKGKPEVQQLYQNAIEALHIINCCENRPAWLPRYSDGLLRQEMELFPSWFVKKLLDYSVNAEEAHLISFSFDYLVAQALDQPKVLVHRDYHCRNLLHTDDKGPGVIDFQDAVWGPVTYDLVSISRDCYVRWEISQVDKVRDEFAARLLQNKIISEGSVASFPNWFECMSAQRHLKVLGIFARLALRDGKTDYLENLPLALRYLLEACERVSELEPLGEWIKSTLVPRMESQPWYIDWTEAGNEVTVW